VEAKETERAKPKGEADDPISTMFVVSQHIYIDSILYITSSTAQGGGGSFKDRKPIGEVWFVETHGWQSDLMDQTVAEALNLSVSLSASRLLSPLFIFLYQSA
jgi:hypothetical protein